MNFVDTPLFVRLLAQSPLSKRELIVLAETAPARYKEHFIEKRNGRGKRLISQPTAELKFFQRLLVNFELSDLKVHSAATAYVTNRSIKQHALPHANSKYLLKLDFQNFFPSLSSRAIKELLSGTGRYSSEETHLACQLLCKRVTSAEDLRLSIGAPSSPFLSNALMYEFDELLADYCLENSLIYTRYADDIALSTSAPQRLDHAHEFVLKLLSRLPSLDLRINDSKTVNVSRKRRRTLTGLTLSNSGNASVGREKKRMLRAALNQLAKAGRTEMSQSKLKGMLAFVYSLDPEWVLRLCKRHGFSSINDISTGTGSGSLSD